MDLRRGHFSVKIYVKTKELGPMGGHVLGTPPRSANGHATNVGRDEKSVVSQ